MLINAHCLRILALNMSIGLRNHALGSQSRSPLGRVALVLHFLDFDGCFLGRVGELLDFLPRFVGVELGADGAEELVEGYDERGFEKLGGELVMKMLAREFGNSRKLVIQFLELELGFDDLGGWLTMSAV